MDSDEAEAWWADFRKKCDQRGWLAFLHGKNTRKYFDMLEQQGLIIDEDRGPMKALAEREARSAAQQGDPQVTRNADGSVDVSIRANLRAHKEQTLNGVIASLGDRTGDDPAVVSRDLAEALRTHDLALGDDMRMEIAELLAGGEEVVIRINS